MKNAAPILIRRSDVVAPHAVVPLRGVGIHHKSVVTKIESGTRDGGAFNVARSEHALSGISNWKSVARLEAQATPNPW